MTRWAWVWLGYAYICGAYVGVDLAQRAWLDAAWTAAACALAYWLYTVERANGRVR